MKAVVARIGVLVALVGAAASAGTKTWDGSESRDWSAGNNWVDGSAPVNGDDLVFTSGNPPNQPANNGTAGLQVNSLSFNPGTFAAPLYLGGSAITLQPTTAWPTLSSVALARSGSSTVTGTYAAHGLLVGARVTVSGAGIAAYNGTFGVVSVPTANTFTYTAASSANDSTSGSVQRNLLAIENLMTTAGRAVTISNAITVVGSQSWRPVNNSASPVVNLLGDITSASGVTVSIDNEASTHTLRLGGNNSAFAGTIDLTASAGTKSVSLLTPQSQIAGNIALGGGNGKLFLQGLGSGAGNTYTFGLGSGNGNVNTRDEGAGSSGGIGAFGSQTCHWRIGGSGNASWSDRFENPDTPVAGERPWIIWGASGDVLTLAANREIRSQANGNPIRVDYTLADGGTARSFTLANNGLVVLNGGVAQGNLAGTTTVAGGALAISNVDQIFNGNLNLSGGVLVLDGVSWSQFVADRASGTGANQWQLSGTGSPGFAARETPLTVNGSGTTTSTFNRSFSLGSGARDTTGAFYANAPVTVAQGIDLTSQVVGISAAQTGPGLGLPGSNGVVYALSGAVADAAASTGALAFYAGSGTASAESAVGELVLAGTLAHTGSTWASINTTGPNSGRGGLVTRCLARFASPSALPTGALSLTTPALLVGESWSGTAGYLFTGDEDGETYDLGNKYLQLALGVFSSGGQAGTANSIFGTHAGKVTLRNTTLHYGMRANNGTTYLYALTRDDSVLTLGADGAGNDFRFVAAASEGEAVDGGRTAAAMTISNQATISGRPIIKRGTGTLVLQNVRYTDVAGTGNTTSRFAWQIGRKTNPATPTTVQFDGAVREGATTGPSSLSAFQYQLNGGVLELDAALYPSGFAKNGTATSGTANTIRWGDASGAGGEGGGGFAALNGDVTVTITNGTGVNNVNVGWPGSQFGTGSALNTGAALIFGSKTGDSTVRMNNDLYLGSAGSGDNTRSILVVADTNPAKPEAVILGAVKDGTANNALTLIGDGTLVLSGSSTYTSRTRVYGGLLVLDGTLASATYGITVYSGGALGGTGTVARAVSVEAGGVIAATSATSPTGLQITGTLTVDGLIGVRLPTIAPGTYNVATASGGVTLNSTTVESLPEDFTATAWVDGNTLKLKISSAAGPTVILLR